MDIGASSDYNGPFKFAVSVKELKTWRRAIRLLPVLEPCADKLYHLRVNLANLSRFFEDILETPLVPMMYSA